MQLVSGTTVYHLYARDLASFRFRAPSVEQQTNIVSALSDIDGIDSALDRLIAKKWAIKQVTMMQLIRGEIRLPGFKGEWKTTRLGDIAEFLKGKGLSKTDLSPDGKKRCIHYGELFTTYGERIDDVLHGTNREGTYFYSTTNDVLMPTSDVTPNGLAKASCILLSDIIVGGDILVIRAPRCLINGEFLAYVITVHRNLVMQLVSGTTVFHLYGRDMAAFNFSLPDVDEQTAITGVLSDMEAEIATLELRRQKTRAIKQGMMQHLLTGRVQLVKPVDPHEGDLRRHE